MYAFGHTIHTVCIPTAVVCKQYFDETNQYFAVPIVSMKSDQNGDRFQNLISPDCKSNKMKNNLQQTTHKVEQIVQK